MKNVIHFLERINDKIGKAVSYTTLLLVLLISLEVLLRYFFQTSYMSIREVETYLFAFMILWGAGYTFQHDSHVRVDVFYDSFSPKKKAWVNLLGGILFLIPWMLVLLSVCWQMSIISLKINESSAQAGGLPAVYLLKFSIFIGFGLLFLQGLVSIYRAVEEIKQ